MTTKQAENYEALITLVQIGVRKIADGVYSAPSESESAPHIVTVDEAGNPTYCTCKFFKNGGWQKYHLCKHALAVTRFIEAAKVAQEAESVQAAIAAVEAVIAEEEEVLSNEETAELVALLNGPKVGPFASIDEMVAAMAGPTVEYIRVQGALVRKDAQVRSHERGVFNLYR